MFGYYYASLMTAFLLFDAPRVLAGYKVKTTKSLLQLAECGKKEQLQIVKAVYDQQNKSLPIPILIDIYNATDEVSINSGNDPNAKSSAKEKLKQIENTLEENFTVDYFCVSGDIGAVNPCYQAEVKKTSMSSVTLLNNIDPSCSRRCILKPSRPTGTHNIIWNVLFNETQSSSFKGVYSTDGGNVWQCLDTRFHNQSTRGAPLHLQFSWKSRRNIPRFWFSFDGVPFNVACREGKDDAIPTCSKPTTSVDTTTTSKSVAANSTSPIIIRPPPTVQSGLVSDNRTQIIIAVVVVAGVVIIAIIVAVAVYQVKKQSRDPVRLMNPDTNQSAAVANAQFEPFPPTAGEAPVFHRYSELQPPLPETGTADPREDAEQDNRKRKAYCHYAEDYEDWVIPNIARERAVVQNNM